jgi:hypothetical protein
MLECPEKVSPALALSPVFTPHAATIKVAQHHNALLSFWQRIT